ncbi:hypothetical protein [Paenarthrobacter sp. YJN-5]|uniref:YunG family protein n=1 Tax=Paenarthrobacter sp. YJN-5 TaxID=2735316 RepID=UPI001878A7E1|nr:hypothetical protein [Paenarthrobacter sp. YJN-5]QOT19491.1 hypothetical protein HMI59_22910 [Paenarthrobacter sp. YJN-5]
MIDNVLAGLHERLLEAWSSETTADPDGYADPDATKSYGQCAVTALVIQNRLGGQLMRTTADGVSHYFNLLPDGTTVDLTRDQFPVTARFTEVEARTRDYVLSHPETRRRYHRLIRRLHGISVQEQRVRVLRDREFEALAGSQA